MTVTRRSIVVAVLSLGCVGIGFALYNWYYIRYLWPADIQRSVAGVELASASALINYDGFSVYGQGIHRWMYEAIENPRLRKMCAPKPISNCRFSRTRSLTSDVQQAVSFEGGVLIVEEVWS